MLKETMCPSDSLCGK